MIRRSATRASWTSHLPPSLTLWSDDDGRHGVADPRCARETSNSSSTLAVGEGDVPTVAFVPHPRPAEAAALAGHAADWLQAHGHQALRGRDELPDWRPSDLVVSLGGDGTMLHSIAPRRRRGDPGAGRQRRAPRLPHRGRAPGLECALERFLAGDYRLEQRMTLGASTSADECHSAVNEAVLEKTSSGHTVRLAVFDRR